VFSVKYELRLRKLLSIGHRKGSNLKGDYGRLRNLHHRKSHRLRHLDYYGLYISCKDNAKCYNVCQDTDSTESIHKFQMQ